MQYFMMSIVFSKMAAIQTCDTSYSDCSRLAAVGPTTIGSASNLGGPTSARRRPIYSGSEWGDILHCCYSDIKSLHDQILIRFHIYVKIVYLISE